MAAPSGTVWGNIVGGKGRVGIYTSLSSTNTQTTVNVQVWFYSKWSVDDSNNAYYFNNKATSATTKIGKVNIDHTVATGTGWNTKNQTQIGNYTYTYNRTTSPQTFSCAAKLSGINVVSDGAAMTVTTTYTIPALVSYTVSYVANGGTGAPSAQVKYYGINLSLSTIKPTRTGYSFLGWATITTATSAEYASGSSFTANANTNLYAVWKANTYAVTFNANGGTGAPANQTKTYGVALTLSSVEPTRVNYNFIGWGTSSTSTSASYLPGASYTSNTAITLYAVWELAYTKPRINGLKVVRCDSNGNTSDDGTYFKMECTWETDKTVSSISVKWGSSSKSITASGTSGTISEILGSGNISTETNYTVTLTIADSNGSTAISRTVPGKAYPIDFKKGGKGVSILKPAQKDGFDIGATTYVNDVEVTGNSLRLAGTNTTASVDEDTVTTWRNHDISVHYYGQTDRLIDQPSTYGYLINLARARDNDNIRQIWLGQPGGAILHRGGNANGWDGTWRLVLDTSNYLNYCVAKTGGTFTGYVNMSNSVNTVAEYRLHHGWLGFYPSNADAHAMTNRDGFMGFQGTDDFTINNQAGGSNFINKAWVTSSDRRLKDEIADISAELVDIWKELLPKTFKWNELNYGNGKIQFGLIAQDVISAFDKRGLDYKEYSFVVPYKMQDDDTEYFSITYDVYHMLTAMVLRETNTKLEEQQQQINSLQEQINELRNLLSS